MSGPVNTAAPFVLLDDARSEGAADAQLFSNPDRIFSAHRPAEVASVLQAADTAQRETGRHLAGFIAYEAGLALEPKLHPLAAARSGGSGPLVWLGLFDAPERISAAQVPAWLAAHANSTPAPSIGPLDPQLSIGGYMKAFARLQEAIRAGDIYQANLTFPLAGSYRGDPLSLYAAIRPAANAGYGGLVFDGSHWLLSFSPELFVATDGTSVKAKPMKGTRPRSIDPAQDSALADELSASVKDRAENLMIVDLMRNDLSRVAQPGSVKVDRPFTVESYPTVHQMVSSIRAKLKPGTGALDLVRALFPCGSITGAPKIRAMELIAEVERDARGPYCGAIGRIAPPEENEGGEAAFNVAIRTLRLTPVENGHGQAVLGVGSAIVADSLPLAEWRECVIKGGFVRQSSAELRAAGFDLIETMRFEPDSGIDLLELHLQRIGASAAELGFAFDRHEVRNRIQALCFELEEAARLRLVLARSGAIALEASPLPEGKVGAMQCALLALPVDEGDWRLRHKSTDRGFYEDALAIVRRAGGDEAILLRDDGCVTEGSFTNIFVPSDEDDVLLTPPLEQGLLPGVLRRSLIESGKAREAAISLGDLARPFYIGNAVRGLMKARLLGA